MRFVVPVVNVATRNNFTFIEGFRYVIDGEDNFAYYVRFGYNTYAFQKKNLGWMFIIEEEK